MSYDISITALERGVRTWAKQLEKLGLTVEIDVFRTGPGGGVHYGPSTVELTLEKGYTDEHGEAEEFYFTAKFVAGGYGELGDRAIGGNDGWRAMKAEANRRLRAQHEWVRAIKTEAVLQRMRVQG